MNTGFLKQIFPEVHLKKIISLTTFLAQINQFIKQNQLSGLIKLIFIEFCHH